MWRFTGDLPTASRPDGREPHKFRDILINWGSIRTADGSAIIKLGNTTVIGGVTFDADEIELKDDRTFEQVKEEALANADSLVEISVKYQPHCSFSFKMQGNEADAKESLMITRHFKQILKNAKLFDPVQLIKQSADGKWTIINRMCIEILVENYDGNAFDACNLALLASLLDCTLDGKHLKLDNYPVSTTFAFRTGGGEEQTNRKESKDRPKDQSNGETTGREMLYHDPNLDDEKLSAGLFNIVVNADTNQLILLNKTGGEGVSIDGLRECIRIATKRAVTIKKHLKSKQTKL